MGSFESSNLWASCKTGKTYLGDRCRLVRNMKQLGHLEDDHEGAKWMEMLKERDDMVYFWCEDEIKLHECHTEVFLVKLAYHCELHELLNCYFFGGSFSSKSEIPNPTTSPGETRCDRGPLRSGLWCRVCSWLGLGSASREFMALGREGAVSRGLHTKTLEGCEVFWGVICYSVILVLYIWT